MIKAAITGVGGYVPDYVLTNEELSKMVDTNDEWITSRTGIKERRILKGEGKALSDMCVEAINDLQRKTPFDPLEIDLIIVGTITSDYHFPSASNIISDKIGAKNAWGFDLSAACSGFIYSLATASQFIETGKYKKVLVVGADMMSTIIDYTDRSTCIIFGDGAGVVMLEPNTEGLGVQDFILKSDGSGKDYLSMPGGGSLFPASHYSVDSKLHFVKQEGQSVFKFAVKGMADVSVELLEKNGLKGEDIQWLVPHQANLRIIDATANRAGIAPEKVLINIDKYGNTTSGTIPLLLWEYENKFKKGDSLLISAFGGGFTWGSLWLKWAY